MAPPPKRTRKVFFLGAGFSRALGLPNTAELLTEVHRLAQARNLRIDNKLKDAYNFFYPEEATTFVPDVVDFFSVLRAYEDVSGSADGGTPRFRGGFKHPGLLTELRLAVVRLLCERLRQVPIPPTGGWPKLEQMFSPGNVVVTSNWDLFVEWYASQRGTRLRLGGDLNNTTLTLIKLHGSIDWTEPRFRKPGYRISDFAVLRELQNSSYTIHNITPDEMLRIRAVENVNRSWQFINARTSRPHMIMMSQGKTVDMARMQSMWDDAYTALCAASELHIIGYSLPFDDVEIRTLLRAGIGRGTSEPRIVVHNPEPGVHVRVRTFVSRHAESDYGAFSPF
jgi:hypothetical protein